MAESDYEPGVVPPTEQSGGTTPDKDEAREKGGWGGEVADGVVPADLGGSDAPREMLPDDPELGSSVLGRTTDSDEPATPGGVPTDTGDSADATSDGGPDLPSADAEPAQSAAPAASRSPDREDGVN
jgi:hypothetical protein